MKKGIILALCAWVWPWANAAAQDTASVTYEDYHATAVQIRRQDHAIDLDRFLALRADADAVVIDLRDRADYDRAHIKGAVHLGADIHEDTLAAIIPSKDSIVLLYCSNSLTPSRRIALTDVSLPQFIVHGYKNVYTLNPVWGAGLENLPMEGAAVTGADE